MAGSFEVDGQNISVTFEYTADLTKAKTVVNDAAHYLYDRRYGEELAENFDDLTSQQKLDIVDAQVKRGILAYAKSYSSDAAQVEAKAQAEQDAKDNYDLGE